MKSEMLSSKELRIIEQFGKILYKFPVLHDGWENDNIGYIVTNGQENKVILTNHSKPYEASSDELLSKLKEYQTVIEKTNESLKILNE